MNKESLPKLIMCLMLFSFLLYLSLSISPSTIIFLSFNTDKIAIILTPADHANTIVSYKLCIKLSLDSHFLLCSTLNAPNLVAKITNYNQSPLEDSNTYIFKAEVTIKNENS